MKITLDVFEAYLKCPTKCWLRSTGEPSAGNTYPEWVKTQNDSYRTTGTERLLAESPKDEVLLSPDMENIKGAKWRLARRAGERKFRVSGTSARFSANDPTKHPRFETQVICAPEIRRRENAADRAVASKFGPK